VSDLHFAAPGFAHALWGVAAVLAGLLWLEARAGRRLGTFVAAPMQPRLVDRVPRWRRRATLLALGASLLGIVLALMRPQWGFDLVTTRPVGAEIMIALDVSRSMLAEDVAPNRLERAKAEIRDLLTYLEGDTVGLIAFAGRARVLCPLTPDFGFLRLVLDSVDPRTVGRGGTRLEEPIRRALAGFGPGGDAARVILLITDGEDHDSFPVDAARAAAEQGVRILAIGFGDEAGSEIVVTDPETGARRRVTDADGRPVVTRLDGALLRELALVTEGAYVPAGTGVLDLESIFEAHIRPLMRSGGAESTRRMREEAYQWPLLVSWIGLVTAVALGGGRRSMLAGVVACLVAGAAPPAQAEGPPAGAASADAPFATGLDAPPPDDAAPSGGTAAADRATAPLDVPEDPREAFNAGVAALEAQRIDDAERLLETARRRARDDAELRYRATFDLGWVDVLRADTEEEEAPERALAALRRAADWFREAVALRPDAKPPRRNLEIVLARAVALADALAARDPTTLEQQLDALLAAQRALDAELRTLVEQLQATADPNAPDALRGRFDALAVQQRLRLDEARALSERAGDELARLRGLDPGERAAEEAMRMAQLEALLDHQHRARERMGQARSQLRRRQAARAHRRGALALEHLKRAREQLLDPARVLDGVIADAGTLAGETRALAGATRGPDARVEPPEWLDTPYLADVQASITARTAELEARFTAALAAAAEDPDGADAERRAAAEAIGAAAPHVAGAREHFDAAHAALARDEATEGAAHQAEGLAALLLAREQLLDLRGLIELTWADQQRIDAVLTDLAGHDAAPEERAEYAEALADVQHRNLERTRRLGGLVEAAREGLPASADPGTPEDEAAETAEAERERLDLADGLLALTESAMRSASSELARLGEAGSADVALTRSQEATKGLTALRRLFFTLVEHVRDAARRQQALADDAEAAVGLEDEARRDALGPVRTRQAELGRTTAGLADTLHEQAATDPGALVGAAPGGDAEAAGGNDDAAERITRAAEHVLEASEEMEASASGLADPAGGIDAARAHQTAALEQLARALALLEPPQQSGQEGAQDRSADGGEAGEEQSGQQAGEAAEPSAAEAARREALGRDPASILQAVRDREAERHRRRRAGAVPYEPVEKDW
jgi:Ca-activated chloride channel family protein